jgi:hypothetical protein
MVGVEKEMVFVVSHWILDSMDSMPSCENVIYFNL